MIRQALAEMNDTALMKSAFIQITAQDTLATLNTDLKVLESQGFQYVFLDEVTLWTISSRVLHCFLIFLQQAA